MIKFRFITFACAGPDRLAAFWAEAIEGEMRDLPDSLDAAVVERPGAGPNLLFQEGPRGTDRNLPIHLDFDTDDREAEVERLESLGATARETKTEEFETHISTWTVMEDPAGNGFCVTEY